MNRPNAGLGEFDLIRRFFWREVRHRDDVKLGIGDDAALLEVPIGSELVAAVDTLVAGRHFLEGCDARSIGHRALAVNLSDLAAMGATPAWAMLALTLPTVDEGWLEGFSAGLLGLADAHAVALVGGDTTRGPLTISVQIMGHVPKGCALRRSGGRAGDLLAVTGTLGDAGAGLKFAREAVRSGGPAVDGHADATTNRAAVADLIRRFEYPSPRVEFGIAARGIARAAMDLSDGLVGDLPKLAQASGVAAHVAVDALPLSDAMRAVATGAESRDWALAAGDDYELLLAVPPQRLRELEGAALQLNLTLTVIGELRTGSGVTWSLNGKDFLPELSGFDHFDRASTQITV